MERHLQQGKPSIASCLCDWLYPWFDQISAFRTLYNPFRKNGQVRTVTVQQTLILCVDVCMTVMVKLLLTLPKYECS